MQLRSYLPVSQGRREAWVACDARYCQFAIGWPVADCRVEARAAARFATGSTVSCGVPGRDRAGYEVVMDKLEVAGGGFDFVFEGRCGFAATFDYRSD